MLLLRQLDLRPAAAVDVRDGEPGVGVGLAHVRLVEGDGELGFVVVLEAVAAVVEGEAAAAATGGDVVGRSSCKAVMIRWSGSSEGIAG